MHSVLFVSDDRDLRDVAARVLRAAGWDVRAVPHGGHALLACVEGQSFEVLAVDDRMPDETGAALARRLRRYCPLLRTVRLQNQAGAVEADGIAVVRPFTADDLIDAVRQAAATPGATV